MAVNTVAGSRALQIMSNTTSIALDYLVGGVDLNLAGNGGPGCYSHRSQERKVLETLLLGGFCLVLFFKALQYIERSVPHSVPPPTHNSTRQIVLVLFCVMFGIQVGFKFGTRTLIFIFQPCHMITTFQIYLLAAPAHRYTSLLYRIHLGLLNGPLLAIVFPVLDTYSLPFELEMYWIQHVAILLVPLYIHLQGEPYTYTDTYQFADFVLSYSCFVLYHIIILQPIAFVSGVNISTVLCPAPSDPIGGQNFLLHGAWHQAIVIGIVNKMYSFLLTPRTIKQNKME